MLPPQPPCVFSRLRCNGHSLLLKALTSLESAESKILYTLPAAIRPRTSLISVCNVQLRTLCAARSLVTLCLSTTFGPSSEELLVSVAPWSSAMSPSLERVWVTTISVTEGVQHWFSTGEPRMFAYFKNGLACRMRWRNTGPHQQPYGPTPVN